MKKTIYFKSSKIIHEAGSTGTMTGNPLYSAGEIMADREWNALFNLVHVLHTEFGPVKDLPVTYPTPFAATEWLLFYNFVSDFPDQDRIAKAGSRDEQFSKTIRGEGWSMTFTYTLETIQHSLYQYGKPFTMRHTTIMPKLTVEVEDDQKFLMLSLKSDKLLDFDYVEK